MSPTMPIPIRSCTGSGHRSRLMRLLTLCLLCLPTVLQAQDAVDANDSSTMRIALDRAPLVLDGRRLAFIRGLQSYPAKRRVREVSRRIIEFAQVGRQAQQYTQILRNEQITTYKIGCLARDFDPLDGMALHF